MAITKTTKDTKKSVRKGILITERMNEMAEEIAAHKGLSSFTAVVESAIALLHQKTIDYKVLKSSNPSTGLAPADLARIKIEQKQAEKQAEEDLKDEKKKSICERDLFGQVIIDDGGYKYCVFNTNTRTDSKPNKAPLRQIDPVMARSLFIPNRDAVFTARPELAEKLGFTYDTKTKTFITKT